MPLLQALSRRFGWAQLFIFIESFIGRGLNSRFRDFPSSTDKHQRTGNAKTSKPVGFRSFWISVRWHLSVDTRGAMAANPQTPKLHYFTQPGPAGNRWFRQSESKVGFPVSKQTLSNYKSRTGTWRPTTLFSSAQWVRGRGGAATLYNAKFDDFRLGLARILK